MSLLNNLERRTPLKIEGYDATMETLVCYGFSEISHVWSLWRNRLARSAVTRKVGGSIPPRDDV